MHFPFKMNSQTVKIGGVEFDLKDVDLSKIRHAQLEITTTNARGETHVHKAPVKIAARHVGEFVKVGAMLTGEDISRNKLIEAQELLDKLKEEECKKRQWLLSSEHVREEIKALMLHAKWVREVGPKAIEELNKETCIGIPDLTSIIVDYL